MSPLEKIPTQLSLKFAKSQPMSSSVAAKATFNPTFGHSPIPATQAIVSLQPSRWHISTLMRWCFSQAGADD